MSKKVLGVWGLIALFLITLSVVGFGENLLVPEDFSSIQAAVDAAQEGDVVILSSGSYEEDVVISGKKDISIQSQDLREFTTVKGQITVEGSTNIALSGFTVTGPGHGVAVRGETVGLTFEDLAVLQNTGDGLNFSGENTEYNHVDIINSKISSNGGDGINLQGQGNNITIRNNEITANGTYTPAGAAGGVETKGAQAVGVRVGLSEEEAAGEAGGVAGGVLNILIEENIVNDNAFAGIHTALEQI
ncbi:right-handed parallel beta-helix repeat-containing protein [Candidatus Bipolaricaulota bacterium]|nr:right-handed parallel beta-helix repeat-containing protein [Candidatus Bipolaricaulota bacterium]